MEIDFTYDIYRELLVAGLDNDYVFVTIGDYLKGDGLPDRFIMMRHDVDRKPENALTMARLESEMDVRSTYYFRTTSKTFRPSIIEEIASLGHEVGYHYEDLDRAFGDDRRAHELFEGNLRKLRDVSPVETVCMHGNPLTPYDNREMWADGNADPEDYGLLGEAYLSMDFTDVVYFSDTGRTWRDGELKIKDHTREEGEKPVQVDTTRELARLLDEHRIRRTCLVVHPNRWARTYPELVAERTKDFVVNLAKRGINLAPYP
jgi:hypothetical protein